MSPPTGGAPLPFEDGLASDDIDLTTTAERRIVDLAERGMEPLLALGHYRCLRAHGPLPAKRHRSLLVLVLPTWAAFTFEVDGVETQVSPGQALRIPPGTTYRTGVTAQQRGELTWLVVRAGHPGSGEPIDRATALLSDPSGPGVWAASDRVSGGLRRAFGLLTREPDWIGDALAHHLLSATVLELSASLSEAGRPQAWTHRDITRILEWIEEHLTEPIAAADLATMSGLSTSRFYEVFRAATGTSPKDYLLRRKIDRAREWLAAEPGTSITTVAHAFGFSSSQHFARVFRRYRHEAPSSTRAEQGLPPGEEFS
ncbi:AraC family transcriptional regulator [Streptomyces sp. Isolate_45]|uniref:AraC family transcriptional regulator n=1 Tax=Streptomyces sp. Isolate_45 TaxID=2950111 RepID=UPI002481DADD|nr:AraC family transcriptional regulator [Streptomyces sp. Isolate_45]MDA5283716.1 AraC family transcriptional regulator [Streptomyces sp. Isolate_45]